MTPADKRVLVTGATGFIGSHLARRLVGEGAEVHCITSRVSSLYPARLADIRGDVTLHEASLTDRSAIELLVRRVRPQLVYHLGAYTHVGKSWDRPDDCVQINLQGTVNLLQALEPLGCERFVNTGTSEIYGAIDVPFVETSCPRPASPYAMTKHAAEEYCRLAYESRGWPIVRIRPFNAYGPGQTPDRVIPEIIVRAIRGDELLMTSGRQTREFNYVEDLVDGFVRASLAPDVDGELINVGCGEEVSMADLATRILRLMGDPITAKLGALPDRPIEIWRMYCDNTKARELLDWKPLNSLDEGLARTIDWYRREITDHPGSPFIPGFARGT
jgi:nucleoside-diphosphate-sugar epimerase